MVDVCLVKGKIKKVWISFGVLFCVLSDIMLS